MNPIHFFTLGYFEEYLIIGILFGVVIGFYAFFRIRYAINDSVLSKNKKMIICAIIAVLAFLFCLNIWSNAAILTLYLFISSLIADMVYLLWKYLLKGKHLNFIPKIHKKGIFAIIIFAIIMAGSVYGMNHIDLTEYNLSTDKVSNQSYSILFVSDVHYDTVQNPKLVEESIKKMNDLNPDIVVLGGDIVDERTPKESMKEIFKELGTINSTYGTYYVYGNHDRQPYETDYEDGNRTFTDEELSQSIESSGITILEDDKIILNNDIVLVGRADAGWDDHVQRANLSEMIDESDLSKYIVVIDHQPIEQDENSAAGADLEISGHTHGGQVFPYGFLYDFMGIKKYGEYDFGNMKQIVSSGLTGWGWPFRNEAKCEYVFIHVN